MFRTRIGPESTKEIEFDHILEGALSKKETNQRGRQVDHAKKERILRVATELFLERGLDATSIELVARHAKVSKVTIYNHFVDKGGLFSAAFIQEFASIGEQFQFGFREQGALRDRLTSIGMTMHSIINSDRIVQLERRISSEADEHPAISIAFLKEGPYRLRRWLAEVIKQMISNGEIDAIDPSLAAEQFVSMCKGIGDVERRFGHRPAASEDEIRIQAAVETFCRAFEKRR